MKRGLMFSIIVLVIAFMATSVFSELSVDLKRMSPGVVGGEAEVIWDVVNMDMIEHIEGFVVCKTPDDLMVTKTDNVASGAAQYVSPLFEVAPAGGQKSVSLTFTTQVEGDHKTGCRIKYITFSKLVKELPQDPIDYRDCDGVYELGENECKGLKFTILPQAENSVSIVINDGFSTIDVEKGGFKTVGVKFENEDEFALNVYLIELSEEQAQLEFTGIRTPIIKEETKTYYYPNGDEIPKSDMAETVHGLVPKDEAYKTIALDNMVPFVKAPKDSNPKCPDAEKGCSAKEVIVDKVGSGIIPYVWIVIAVAAIIVLVVYLMGKTSRRY